MDLALIKQLCSSNKLRWTNHIFIRLTQRNISMESGTELWLITAYVPSRDKWLDDFKTRKVE